jgi:hypothetical protein
LVPPLQFHWMSWMPLPVWELGRSMQMELPTFTVVEVNVTGAALAARDVARIGVITTTSSAARASGTLRARSFGGRLMAGLTSFDKREDGMHSHLTADV